MSPCGTTSARSSALGAEAWQEWVRTILIDHADDPALIAVID